MNARTGTVRDLSEDGRACADAAPPSLGDEEMSAANPSKGTLETDRSERIILFTLAFVAAAEVCVVAWLLY